MSQFTDADDRRWSVVVTTVEITRVRDELEVDLLDVGNEQLFHRLLDDHCLIVDVLHICCRDQCSDQDVDAVSFARGLRGDALDAAVQAFLSSYVSFFPKHRRAVLETAFAKTEEFLQRTSDHTIETINGEAMERMLTEKLKTISDVIDASGPSSPNGEASPASTPPPE